MSFHESCCVFARALPRSHLNSLWHLLAAKLQFPRAVEITARMGVGSYEIETEEHNVERQSGNEASAPLTLLVEAKSRPVFGKSRRKGTRVALTLKSEPGGGGPSRWSRAVRLHSAIPLSPQLHSCRQWLYLIPFAVPCGRSAEALAGEQPL